MRLNITLVEAETGVITTTRVRPADSVSSLHDKVHRDLQIPPANQDLQFNGNTLDPHRTISAVGLADGDLVMVHRRAQTTPALPNAAAMLSAFRSDPALMARLRAADPALHARVLSGDATAVGHVMNLLRSAAQQHGERIDPMSADAQKAIEERIRQENVARNLEAAMEHNPESFGRVVMLFVDCKLNSVPGVKAFVDSGAQTTIISRKCAERCNILRLMDRRFAGLARGVGTAKIHGRIHLALLTLDKEVFEVSLTVMDAVGGGYDLLLGLDMLRKHQASVDLKHNCLRIGQSAVPFLPEKDIPREMREHDGPSPLPHDARAGSPRTPEATPTRGSASRSGPSGASSTDSDPVKRLQELGFSRDDAIQALQACDGDADQAATMLAAKKYGF